MFQEGQQIGLYTLIRKLGKGGFGEVWLAERRSELVTTKVAVKLPHEEQIDIEAIKQEAVLWAQASGHANVLPIIDADIYDDQVVIVSEFADGGSLHEKLEKAGRLPVNNAVEMIIGILNGLEFLHNKRIIHRDIKPQNILLQGETPRLADFGISRAMQTTMVSSTVVGTDAYMAPEAFKGERSVGTDIWSVGVVLYQLLGARLPFPQEHPSERMFAILQNDIEPMPDSVPQELKKVISRALEKQPENRYQSAALMREDLQTFLYGTSAPDIRDQPTKPSYKPIPIPSDSSDMDKTKVRTSPVSHSQEVTKVRVPIETEKVTPVLESFTQTPKKRSLVGPILFLVSVLIGGFVIAGLGLVVMTTYSNEIAEIINGKPNNNSTPEPANSSNGDGDSDEKGKTNPINTPTPKPTATPTRKPTPKPTPKPKTTVNITVKVTLASKPPRAAPGAILKIQSKGKTYRAITNRSGLASFRNVRCGGRGTFYIDVQVMDGTFPRTIKCGKNLSWHYRIINDGYTSDLVQVK